MVPTLDEMFTNLADKVTEGIGKWWFTVLSLVLLVAWVLYGVFIIGPHWFSSTDWGLPFNAVTSGGEWFMEGLILAAANRVERRNAHLLECLLELMQKVDAVVEREEQELAQLTQPAHVADASPQGE